MNAKNGITKYKYPGNETDPSGTLVYKSRAFYGQILKDVKGIIWYQEQLKENHSWSKTIFLLNLTMALNKTRL
ncbi:MAG: hypothetical protein JWN56_1519 [Sphingobacteriales bacterium]|nr:hypothetical protein [Sphingobacteriales bacterium]